MFPGSITDFVYPKRGWENTPAGLPFLHEASAAKPSAENGKPKERIFTPEVGIEKNRVLDPGNVKIAFSMTLFGITIRFFHFTHWCGIEIILLKTKNGTGKVKMTLGKF